MDTVSYPEAKVISLISQNFIPVKCNVGEDKALPQRFNVNWTPTLVIADVQQTVHHSIIGFMPPEELLSQLEFAQAKTSFNKGDYQTSLSGFGRVVEKYPRSLIAPEALYWTAVSEYKGTGSRDALMNGWKRLQKEYPDSEWARKIGFVFEQK
jgi:TolA-binding protein